MSIPWTILCVLGYVLHTWGRKVNFKFCSLNCTNYRREIVQANCSVIQNKQGKDALFMEFIAMEDLSNLTGDLRVEFLRSKKFTPYLTLDMDFCTSLYSLHRDYLVQMFLLQIRRVGNFPFQCPFEKNKRYFLDGWTMDAKAIPSYMPDMAFNFKMRVLMNKRRLAAFVISGAMKRI